MNTSCDVIKNGCDFTLNSYDVMHIVGLMSHILRAWYNQCTLSNDAATGDAMSNILGLMTWIQGVWCHRVVWYHKEWMWCHLQFIRCHKYCGCDIIHTVGVIGSIIWVWWQTYSGCAVRYNGCDVRYTSFDAMNRVLWCHKAWVWCHIYYILCHTYSMCDIIHTVCVISLIEWVWSHRYRYGGCDVRYSGCIILTQCVWSHI